MKIIIFVIMISFSFAAKDLILSDVDYTNQNFTLHETQLFIKSFPRNKFTTNEMELIYNSAKTNGLNILAVLARVQAEQDLVNNNLEKNYSKAMQLAMGYGHINMRPEYLGFKNQIVRGTECMKRHFNNFAKGEKIELLNTREIITPKNAATFALYVYNPYYGLFKWRGVTLRGNDLYERIFAQYKKKWENMFSI